MEERWRPGSLLSLCSAALQEDETLEVVDEIGEAYLHPRPSDPNGSDEQLHSVLLLGEDMFDMRADFRFGVVGAPHRLRYGTPFRLLAMELADKAVLLQEGFIGLRAIGRICPHGTCRIGLVEQPLAQLAAFVSSRVGRRPFADEAETAIDRDVILIAEDRDCKIDGWRGTVCGRLSLGELHRPSGVAILLPQLGGLVLPAVGNAPLLDRFLLFLRVALARRGDQAGVDDLARHSDVARFPQCRVEAFEQRFDGARFR